MDTEKKFNKFMKPWRKPQVTTVTDEHPRKWGLPVPHSEPDCHSHFFYVVFKLLLIHPGLSFLKANKKGQYLKCKAACRTCPRRDRGAVSNEKEDKKEGKYF